MSEKQNNINDIVDIVYLTPENAEFSVTANNFLQLKAHVSYPETLQDNAEFLIRDPEDIFFEFVNVRLEPRADGTFDGRLRMGNIIKPYFGIGLGRIIPNSNIGFQFDLGVAYQGRLRFISDQATIGNVNEEIHSEHIPEGLEIISTIADIFRFWPVMNFSLSYRF